MNRDTKLNLIFFLNKKSSKIKPKKKKKKGKDIDDIAQVLMVLRNCMIGKSNHFFYYEKGE